MTLLKESEWEKQKQLEKELKQFKKEETYYNWLVLFMLIGVGILIWGGFWCIGKWLTYRGFA